MKVSGESFARLAGQVWDEADAKAWDKIEAAGIEITKANDTFVAEVKAVAEPLEQAQIVKVKARGVDAAAVFEEIRQQGAGQ